MALCASSHFLCRPVMVSTIITWYWMASFQEYVTWIVVYCPTYWIVYWFPPELSPYTDQHTTDTWVTPSARYGERYFQMPLYSRSFFPISKTTLKRKVGSCTESASTFRVILLHEWNASFLNFVAVSVYVFSTLYTLTSLERHCSPGQSLYKYCFQK